MYTINGIVYANQSSSDIKVQSVKALDNMMMIVTFTSGEKRLFDATILLNMPVFKVLENVNVYNSVKVEYGVVIWNNGELDVAPEYVYKNSYSYNEIITA
ncbi:DUF2442 domain-containing protein [Anaeromicropila herbilytica]|uniref:DUF2442 domain-containing protein n=1 Tax=Anaeromicropila herbilytica TaxID=2785025 RepID=A0A7R7EHX2_9FIRM|nr:DUF2442 domain-containing protein [Anaeromicropila herbilytica]BCN29055.1 hypothetical protein bsdtb5_03500 [Anaeromicropila herbilytica]